MHSVIVQRTQLPDVVFPPVEGPSLGFDSSSLELMWNMRDLQPPSVSDASPFESSGTYHSQHSPVVSLSTHDVHDRSNLSVMLSYRSSDESGSGSSGSATHGSRQTRSSRKVPASTSAKSSPHQPSHDYLARINDIPKTKAMIQYVCNIKAVLVRSS